MTSSEEALIAKLSASDRLAKKTKEKTVCVYMYTCNIVQ